MSLLPAHVWTFDWFSFLWWDFESKLGNAFFLLCSENPKKLKDDVPKNRADTWSPEIRKCSVCLFKFTNASPTFTIKSAYTFTNKNVKCRLWNDFKSSLDNLYLEYTPDKMAVKTEIFVDFRTVLLISVNTGQCQM